MPRRAVRGARLISIGINEVREQIEGEDPDLVSPGAKYEVVHNAYHAIIMGLLILAVLFTAVFASYQLYPISVISGVMAAIAVFYLLLKMAVRIKKIFDALVSTCIDKEKQRAEKKFLINFSLCLLFALVAAFSPLVQGQVYGVQIKLAMMILCASIAGFYLFAAFRGIREMNLHL